MNVSSKLHAPAALPPVLIGWEAGRAPEQVWTLLRREKSLALAGSRTPAVQPIARRQNLIIEWNGWRIGKKKVMICFKISYSLEQTEQNHRRPKSG
jgi:hypothetical protein